MDKKVALMARDLGVEPEEYAEALALSLGETAADKGPDTKRQRLDQPETEDREDRHCARDAREQLRVLDDEIRARRAEKDELDAATAEARRAFEVAEARLAKSSTPKVKTEPGLQTATPPHLKPFEALLDASLDSPPAADAAAWAAADARAECGTWLATRFALERYRELRTAAHKAGAARAGQLQLAALRSKPAAGGSYGQCFEFFEDLKRGVGHFDLDVYVSFARRPDAFTDELVVGNEHAPIRAELSAFYGETLYSDAGEATWAALLGRKSFTVLLRDASGIAAAVTCKLASSVNGAPVVYVVLIRADVRCRLMPPTASAAASAAASSSSSTLSSPPSAAREAEAEAPSLLHEEVASTYLLTEVRQLLDGMLVQAGITRGHLLCQSVGYRYELEGGVVQQWHNGSDAAGRHYWSKQLSPPAAEGAFMAAQLAMTAPGWAEPDCTFLHEAYSTR